MANKWLTPQQIVDADARQMVDYWWPAFDAPGCDHATVNPSQLRAVMLVMWNAQMHMPEFMSAPWWREAWQDGGVFAEAFDRLWRERVEQKEASGEPDDDDDILPPGCGGRCGPCMGGACDWCLKGRP